MSPFDELGAELDPFRIVLDFDSPQSFDYDKLRQVIEDLKACKSVQVRFPSPTLLGGHLGSLLPHPC